MIYYIALALSIILNAISLLLLKSFAVRIEPEANKTLVSRIKSLFKPAIIVCVFLYGLAAFFWLIALLKVDLMVAYPSLASTYVIIAISSKFMFEEKIMVNRWVGIFFIIAGVVVMNVS
jgi:undecaprenyl phosphate-alpha-L-ara4N flippase subunit ArnE